MVIYYAIIVASPEEGPMVFRKKTALQFPSPMGTALHVTFVSGCFAVVNGYAHQGVDSDEFYVFLSPMDELDRKDIEIDGEKCSSTWFGFTDEEYTDNEKALLQSGWDLDEYDLFSYPDPFHHCRS